MRGLEAIEQGLARLYARIGSRIVWLLVGVGAAIIVPGVAITTAWTAKYLDVSIVEDGARMVVVSGPVVALAAGLTLVAVRRDLRRLLAWPECGREPEQAIETWHAAIGLAPRGATLGLTFGAPGFAIIAVYIIGTFDLPARVALPMFLAFVTAGLATLTIIYYGSAMALRPLVEDVARSLPGDFEPVANPVRLQTKAVVALPVITLVTALTVGAFADESLGGPERVAMSLAVGGGSLLVAGLLQAIITQSVLSPIDDLIQATDRVREGDLDVRVPVVTDDDLGLLAAAFNRMLQTLREGAAELHSSRARLAAAGDAGRRRVERALRDGPGHDLERAQRKLEAAVAAIDEDDGAAATLVAELRDDIADALSGLRELAHGIYPVLLENEGLTAAIADHAARSPTPTRVASSITGRYDREIETAIYFCCLEAYREAQVSAIDDVAIHLSDDDGTLRFAVTGRAKDASSTPDESEVRRQAIADRLGALGGSIDPGVPERGRLRIAGSVPVDVGPVPRTATATVGKRDPVARAFALLYARLGRRIVHVSVLGAVVLTAITGAIASAGAARYLQLTMGEILAIAAVALPLVAVMAVVLVFRLRHDLRFALTWFDVPPSAGRAQQIWPIVVHGPLRTLVAGPVVALPILAIMLVLLLEYADEPWSSAPAISAALVIVGAAAWFVTLASADLTFRPWVADVAAHLPAEFEPPVRGWRLRTRALAPLPVVTLYAAMLTGAFGDAVGKDADRLAVALGIGIVFSILAGGVFSIVVHSALDPLDDLIEAARLVRDGEDPGTVPVVTADELGVLTCGFNRMLVAVRADADELRASRARIVAATDAERRRVERDIHDGAQQHLVLAQLKLGLLATLLERDRAAARDLTHELRSDLGSARDELRDLAHGIYPAALERGGLAAAVGEAAARTGLPSRIEAHETQRWPRDIEAAVYFCCVEALQNAAKHAGPGARTAIVLGRRNGRLEFSVQDDGRGCDPAAAARSGGLQNMVDRINALGGALRIESEPRRGTRVLGSVPLGGS